MTDKGNEVGTDVERLVGRTITAAVRNPPSGEDWGHAEESLTLTLDDGSVWEFEGWGYDASGLTVSVTDPPCSVAT
jgi:YD repeat-containing protein